MSTWLKLLPMELDGISECVEPDRALEKSDTLVGEMSDMTRRLFTLGKLLEKDSKQLHLDANYCNSKTEKLELYSKAQEFLTKADILKELMWIGIRDQFGLWDENSSSIGVCEGFKVVLVANSSDDISSLFRALFGG